MNARPITPTNRQLDQHEYNRCKHLLESAGYKVVQCAMGPVIAYFDKKSIESAHNIRILARKLGMYEP